MPEQPGVYTDPTITEATQEITSEIFPKRDHPSGENRGERGLSPRDRELHEFVSQRFSSREPSTLEGNSENLSVAREAPVERDSLPKQQHKLESDVLNTVSVLLDDPNTSLGQISKYNLERLTLNNPDEMRRTVTILSRFVTAELTGNIWGFKSYRPYVERYLKEKLERGQVA